MERKPRREPEERDAPPRRPPARSSGLGIVVVLGVLLGAALLFFLTTKKEPVQAGPQVQQDPFAGLPPELPPEKQAKTKGQQSDK